MYKQTKKTENKQRKGSRIAVRVRNTNIILLALVFASISITVTIMGSGITSRISKELAFFYSVETVDKFNLYMSRDLVMVQEMAKSEAIIDWFADEYNSEKRAAAYSEMKNYFSLVGSAELYFGID